MTSEERVISHLLMAIVLLTVAIIFVSSYEIEMSDAASIIKQEYVSFRRCIPIDQGPSIDLDYQKSIDIWKSNPKLIYMEKTLTTNLYIWQFLTNEMDLSDEAAAGIFGNMMVECGGYSFNLQPYIYSPGGTYYGLCQWGTSNHHSGIRGGTLEQQLEYLRDTIESEMGSSCYRRFTESDTASEASVIFARWYERCSDPYGRRECAERAYERFAGN